MMTLVDFLSNGPLAEILTERSNDGIDATINIGLEPTCEGQFRISGLSRDRGELVRVTDFFAQNHCSSWCSDTDWVRFSA